METALWALQILLALVFALAGAGKLLQSRQRLAVRMAWVEDVPQSVVHTAGAAEVAGAAGLVLPVVTGIGLFLVPLAALGLALVMLLAARLHARRHETGMVVANLVLFVLALVVAGGRLASVPA